MWLILLNSYEFAHFGFGFRRLRAVLWVERQCGFFLVIVCFLNFLWEIKVNYKYTFRKMKTFLL